MSNRETLEEKLARVLKEEFTDRELDEMYNEWDVLAFRRVLEMTETREEETNG